MTRIPAAPALCSTDPEHGPGSRRSPSSPLSTASPNGRPRSPPRASTPSSPRPTPDVPDSLKPMLGLRPARSALTAALFCHAARPDVYDRRPDPCPGRGRTGSGWRISSYDPLSLCPRHGIAEIAGTRLRRNRQARGSPGRGTADREGDRDHHGRGSRSGSSCTGVKASGPSTTGCGTDLQRTDSEERMTQLDPEPKERSMTVADDAEADACWRWANYQPGAVQNAEALLIGLSRRYRPELYYELATCRPRRINQPREWRRAGLQPDPQRPLRHAC